MNLYHTTHTDIPGNGNLRSHGRGNLTSRISSNFLNCIYKLHNILLQLHCVFAVQFFPLAQVFQSDGTFVGKFGSSGSKPGQLEHPHYIAVSSTNRVIVSDSNNHRIQIFDVNGRVLTTFGSEGSEEGQFKFPR